MFVLLKLGIVFAFLLLLLVLTSCFTKSTETQDLVPELISLEIETEDDFITFFQSKNYKVVKRFLVGKRSVIKLNKFSAYDEISKEVSFYDEEISINSSKESIKKTFLGPSKRVVLLMNNKVVNVQDIEPSEVLRGIDLTVLILPKVICVADPIERVLTVYSRK